MSQHKFTPRIVALTVSLLIFFSLSACKKDLPENNDIKDANVSEIKPDPYPTERLNTALEEIRTVTGVTRLDTVILIDGNDNKMYLVDAQNGLNVIGDYVISASKYGYGAERGSNQTPWGVHVIDSKYGDGAPLGMCFYDRRPTGEIATIYTDTTNVENDPVTSRIIWLKGMEDINHTSYWRFVYIHGTHEEGLLGTPQSKGCIRMSNKDVIELFGLVDAGTYVNIIRPNTDGSMEE